MAELEAALARASERERATAEILNVIARSRADVQPVFEAIAARAQSLCGALYSTVYRYDGHLIHHAADTYPTAEMQTTLTRSYGFESSPLDRDTATAKAIRERRVVHIADVLDGATPAISRDAAIALGYRTLLCVPMLNDGVPIGAIGVSRREREPFSEAEIELIKTFADQAVIAIENVRLFTETKEALEQQTATADILRVISSSPTDVQPVFDAIVRTGAHLCGADYGFLARYDGTSMAIVAHSGATNEEIEAVLRVYPMAPTPDSLGGRTILKRAVIHIPDVRTDPTYGARVIQDAGWRTGLGVPLLREGAAIGLVGLWRREVRPFSDRQIELLKIFADQAVIAIENVRLFNELEHRNAEVTEALEQQTGTAEILRVISSSPTDMQPVFEAILEKATRLCDAQLGMLALVEGRSYRFVVERGATPAYHDWLFDGPRAINPETGMGRALLTGRPVHIIDIRDEAIYRQGNPHRVATADLAGARTCLWVPMLKEAQTIGGVVIYRREVHAFTEKQISLLKTFADQAVIAIENVRLFTELQTSNRDLTAALNKQTATSDILRVISRSQTDVQPVFDAIVASAVRLLEGDSGLLTRIAGDQIEIAALTSTDPAGDAILRAAYPLSRHSDRVHARVIRDRAPLNVADAQTDPRLPDVQHATARARGYRSHVAVPLLRHDEALGAIAVTRRAPGGFTDDEIALLQTFADQAVIAIENVRLFTELREKNHALTQAHAQVTEALERQTATAEILRVISGSPTDLGPVFDAILSNACRLCGANLAALWRVSGDQLIGTAIHNASPEFVDHMKRNPLTPDRKGPTRLAALERRTVHVADMTIEPGFSPVSLHFEKARTVLSVPLLHDGVLVGVLSMWRREVRPFTEQQVALVQTFADQAVIAIENVRLFTELQARTTELTRSVGELRALGEVGQAISSTLDLRTVLTTIVMRATHLSGTDAGVIYEYDDQREIFVPRATEHLEADVVETMLTTPVRKGEGATGRLAQVHEPNQVPDILIAPAESRVRGALVRAGYRALLAVPLVREDHLLGGLTVIRKGAGAFPPEVIELLRTFATQSALAIQNARLFREIEEKSRQLEVASQHKSEFLANMSHELRTPLNAIIGFSEVLSERMFGDLNEKQDEYLKDIHASGQHLLSLINDILDLSKIEAGRMELEVTDFDLPMAIDNALTLVRQRAARRAIALNTAIDERLGQVQGDERKIRQVLLNLLSNAIKFTPEGGRIDVHAVPRDRMVEVSVTDTGVGIAPEDQEAVFEEFRQVGTADKKVEGTGLGLALSRKFIDLHGGKIWVRSQVGAGATFTFTVPVRRGE